MKIAPFSDDEVKELINHQNNNEKHPYTCDRTNEHCQDEVLIPTKEGLICNCGKYKQTWCH